MERRISKIIFLLFFYLTTIVFCLNAQEAQQDKQIRIHLWAEVDAYPGIEIAPSDSVYSYAIGRLKELADFIMGGMINGWKFEYTPYDKVRNVSEYFAYSPVIPFNQQINPLEYKKPEIIDQKINCWVYCDRTQTQKFSYEAWSSLKHPKIHGSGQGEISEGFDGIKKAYENAIKQAVREYWRGISKNKPKEISGTVLLIKTPRLYITEGRYTVDLDFFMETDRMILYRY